MALLDLNMNERVELKILPDNTEKVLRITRADVTENRKDPSRSNLALVFEVPDDPMVDDIRAWIPIPTEDQRAMDPKAHAKAMIRLQQFIQAFGISFPCDTEDMLGKEGRVLLSEGTDLDGNPNNQVRKYLPSRR